jgi:di/tricarboxylate transporter
MSWEAWFTLAVVLAMVVAMARNLATDMIMLGAVVLFLAAGLFSDAFPDAGKLLSGLGNEAVVTVAVLYVVVAGLSRTGAMDLVTRPLLGRPRTVRGAQARLMFPVAGMSAFLNNTPIVAMCLPVVADLSKRTGIAASKLFMPLSFATILGGVCTLIGTSTNMVIYGLYVAETGSRDGLSMFDPAWAGVPCALVGMAFILATSRWLLPDRRSALATAGDPREYSIEMVVERDSPLIGRTIEEAGLRGLPGLYLAAIERHGRLLPAVASTERLWSEDQLVFVGVVDSMIDLQRVRGLRPATNQVFKLESPRSERCLIEAVVSNRCPLVGQTIRDGKFRSVYNAAVIAVGHRGERVNKKIGDIVLEAGDTLLLEAHPSFADQQKNRKDFFLVSKLEGSTPPGHERAPIALAILLGMVLAAGFELLTMVQAGMIAATLMLVSGCCNSGQARRAIDWEILVTIAAAIGVGETMRTTGLAQRLAETAVGATGSDPWLILVAIYATAMLLTEFLSNNATAAIIYPITMATTASLGLDPKPYLIAVMIAASCGFATPFGYQTNLMVFGPGGYRFSDFLRLGVALDLVVMAVTVGVLPLVFDLRA